MKQFKWGNFDALLKDGIYMNSEGNLNGFAISMAEALQNAVLKVEIPIEEAIEMATIRPALALGVSSIIGKIEMDYPAKFTTFDKNLTWFNVLSPLIFDF